MLVIDNVHLTLLRDKLKYLYIVGDNNLAPLIGELSRSDWGVSSGFHPNRGVKYDWLWKSQCKICKTT